MYLFSCASVPTHSPHCLPQLQQGLIKQTSMIEVIRIKGDPQEAKQSHALQWDCACSPGKSRELPYASSAVNGGCEISNFEHKLKMAGEKKWVGNIFMKTQGLSPLRLCRKSIRQLTKDGISGESTLKECRGACDKKLFGERAVVSSTGKQWEAQFGLLSILEAEGSHSYH